MSPGTSIAHYRITTKLGEGGMGEVYRATDTKLNREVAIKILPESLSHDPDRLARFTREAQVLASLNHPNIAAIYGVEERALVMELVEGQTLAERIKQAPIIFDEALPLIHQLIDALEYAHERGVIHRDLKPANIKINPDVRLKVLDFGLAKALGSQESISADPGASPTLTMRATVAGVIMGTAAYMSPEQARGQNVDKRSDIWSFGVVLYEMFTGTQLFGGPTISDTLAGVLKTELDLSAVPDRIRPVVERCLRRDAKKRWRDIGDVRVALDEDSPTAAADSPARSRNNLLPWAIAGMMAIAAGVAFWSPGRRETPAAKPLVRLNVDLGPDAVLGMNNTVAISDDGARIVFPVRGSGDTTQLATRLLEQNQTTILPGTVDGSNPVFSPDGNEIAFFSDGSWKKISVRGGAPVTLATTSFGYGGALAADGSLIFARDRAGPLFRVGSAGGAVQAATRLANGEETQRWPQILPGGRYVLLTAGANISTFDSGNIEAADLKTGENKILVRNAYYGRYLPSGHLVYFHQGASFAVPFNPSTLELRGSPIPLLEDVASSPPQGSAQLNFSNSGTLVYTPGKAAEQVWSIDWMDSTGAISPLMPPGSYFTPRFSPDGRRIATQGGSGDVFIYDTQRDNVMRLTSTGGIVPVWAPDGKHIVYASSGIGGFGLWWVRSDGGAEPQKLLDGKSSIIPWSFTPDGKRLAYHITDPDTQGDLWTLPLDLTDPEHPKAGQPEVFLKTPENELVPTFSPDGRWIAYRSSQGGASEIYVRPYPPGSGGRWQISTGGGIYGIWSPQGHQLFYETSDYHIMVVDYTIEGDTFIAGKPRLWSGRKLFFTGASNFTIHPDGKRFAVLNPPPKPSTPDKSSVHVTFLFNFFDDLRHRIP